MLIRLDIRLGIKLGIMLGIVLGFRQGVRLGIRRGAKLQFLIVRPHFFLKEVASVCVSVFYQSAQYHYTATRMGYEPTRAISGNYQVISLHGKMAGNYLQCL